MENIQINELFSIIRNGASIKQKDNATGYPITRIETISNKVVDRTKFGYADITNIEKYKDFILQENDILMSHINSAQHLGKSAIYNKVGDEIIIHGMNLLLLRCNNKLYPKYAFYYFNSKAFSRKVIKITKKSVNQASFSVSDLKKITIPYVDFNKQIKITNKLELLGKIIAEKKEQLLTIDLLIKARFIEMFGDAKLNPKNYTKLSWKEIFSTKTGKLDSNAMVENGIYPFFTCAKEQFWIDKYAFDCEALLLAGNNAEGNYDVKYYNGKFNAYQRTYVLQLLNDNNSYHFFKFQLQDKLNYLKLRSKGTNTRYLTMGILNELDFIVPTFTEQQKFTIFVQQIDKSKFL